MTLAQAGESIGRRVRFVTADKITGYGWIRGVAAGRVMVQLDYGDKLVPVRPLALTVVLDSEGR